VPTGAESLIYQVFAPNRIVVVGVVSALCFNTALQQLSSRRVNLTELDQAIR
jgi:hypothetical protein